MVYRKKWDLCFTWLTWHFLTHWNSIGTFQSGTDCFQRFDMISTVAPLLHHGIVVEQVCFQVQEWRWSRFWVWLSNKRRNEADCVPVHQRYSAIKYDYNRSMPYHWHEPLCSWKTWQSTNTQKDVLYTLPEKLEPTYFHEDSCSFIKDWCSSPWLEEFAASVGATENCGRHAWNRGRRVPMKHDCNKKRVEKLQRTG